MIKVEINKENHVMIYVSAKEMVVKRYSRFQKYLLLEAGVGDSIESVSTHFQKLHSFLGHQMISDAIKEAENLHLNFYTVLQEIDYNSFAFACMVHSINDKPLTDISEENLSVVIQQLSDLGLTKEIVDSQVSDTKKKIANEILFHFPGMNKEDDSLQFFSNLKQKIMLSEQLFDISITEDVVQLNKIQAALNEIDKIFTEITKPNNFRPSDTESIIYKLENNYEHLCSVLEMNNIKDPENLTIIQFYSRLEYFKKTHSKEPKL